MSNCEFLEKCPVFGRFKHEGVKNMWIESYCQRDGGSACQRKLLRTSGVAPEDVPLDMLPDGSRLDILEIMMRPPEYRTPNDCNHMESCQMFFAGFHEEDNRRVWTGLYCFRRQGGVCVRKKMFEEGHIPADSMLPDGNSLRA